jgi:hypothetical protein
LRPNIAATTTPNRVVAVMVQFQLAEVLDFLERYNGMAIGEFEPLRVPGEPIPQLHIGTACRDRKPEEVRQLTALLIAGRAWRA